MERAVIRPKLITGPLPNPGIGFMTFQRFNGDTCNPDRYKWTEGHPIEYQPWSGSVKNPEHPDTTLAYFRVYWRYIEPEDGVYRWDILDKALKTANERGQTLLLRLPPHGHNPKDNPDVELPGWFRALIGPQKDYVSDKWICDCNNPLYAEFYGRFIKAAGQRYNGHPDLESVDMGLIGPWGEGADARYLKEPAKRALCDAYIDSFPDTHLTAMLGDDKTNRYILSRRGSTGWRADCLGDMRAPGDASNQWGFNHMLDRYPQQIEAFGLRDCWKAAPVTGESCWVVNGWFDRGYDLDYIIEQTLAWHISSFSGKSNTIPEEWAGKIQGWIDRMGYRIALRRIDYSRAVKPGGPLAFDTWWQNLGVAPCYRKYPLAFRLVGRGIPDAPQFMFRTAADITAWLPGDALYDSQFHLPWDMPLGDYELQAAFLDLQGNGPKLNLSMEGKQGDGWYTVGPVTVSDKEESPLPAPTRYWE